MTTINEDTGRIIWSTESKYYLLRLIKENIVIISPDVSADTMNKKELAWKNIEESFAADGMTCQLGKLKRLWKRMKDTARQNILRYSDLKKRGMANIKEPTELDIAVAELIAHRNNSKRIIPHRRKIRNPALRVQAISMTNPPPLQKIAPKRDMSMDHNSLNEDDDVEEISHQFDGPLEPMTILEEFDAKPSINTNPSNSLLQNGDETNVTANEENPNLLYPTGTGELQEEVLLQELKLKEVQRENEEEKMEYERQIYRKKLVLLDLQIKKTNLELDYLIKSN